MFWAGQLSLTLNYTHLQVFVLILRTLWVNLYAGWWAKQNGQKSNSLYYFSFSWDGRPILGCVSAYTCCLVNITGESKLCYTLWHSFEQNSTVNNELGIILSQAYSCTVHWQNKMKSSNYLVVTVVCYIGRTDSTILSILYWLNLFVKINFNSTLSRNNYSCYKASLGLCLI